MLMDRHACVPVSKAAAVRLKIPSNQLSPTVPTQRFRGKIGCHSSSQPALLKGYSRVKPLLPMHRVGDTDLIGGGPTE